MAEFDAKKFAEFSGKGTGDKKGKEKAPKAERKKRRKNLLQMISLWNQRRKIQWMPYQRELSIWRNGKGFTLTMMRILPLPGSGSTLTTRITPSGEAITSTMMS